MSGAHREGDRTGIHGMVLFGRSTYFLDHIPMFTRPHDEQLIMRVRLITAQGAPVVDNFSDQGYSVEPTSRFSLDDLVLHKRTAFVANIHRGSFEAGGPLVMAGVNITIDEVLVARNLPGSEPLAAGEQQYFIVGDAKDAYASNVIRDSRGFQQILRLDSLQGATASRSSVLELTVTSLRRLAATTARVQGLLAQGPGVSFMVGPELWCVKAPDFVDPCSSDQ